VRIENSDIYNNVTAGIYANDFGSTTIVGNDVHNNGAEGMYFLAGDGDWIVNNKIHNNAGKGIVLSGHHIFMVSNFIYANGSNGLYMETASDTQMVGGALGYTSSFVSAPNTGAEVLFNWGFSPFLMMKEVRVNSGGIDPTGFFSPNAALLSYTQNNEAGVLRLWGDYVVGGSTFALHYASPLYVSTATIGELKWGTGHSLSNIVTHDATTLSELVTVTATSTDTWMVTGSSSGFIGSVTCGVSASCPFTSSALIWILSPWRQPKT
jgi:hypothetical protein